MRIFSLALATLFMTSMIACQSGEPEGEADVEVAPEDTGELAEEIIGQWRVMEESGRQHADEYFVRFDRDGLYRVERDGVVVDSMTYSLAGQFVTLFEIGQAPGDPLPAERGEDAEPQTDDTLDEPVAQQPTEQTPTGRTEVFRIEVETNGITLRDDREAGRYLVLRRPDFGQIRQN
ncbi:hypothetical protein BH23BAC4_BH23BAC4_10000 [soil metagenome]